MARVHRMKSSSGIYHVMHRGVDKQDIFSSAKDYEIFLEKMLFAKYSSNCKVYGYCLMTNHVHLLIKEEDESIGETIKRIAISYSAYYNKTHKRTGHLFENRFKSEPVENDIYFMTVLRYIHQNPLKAKMVTDINNYQWSSWHNYAHDDSQELVDKDLTLGIFCGKKEFLDFMQIVDDTICLEMDDKKEFSDIELRKKIEAVIKISDLLVLDKKDRVQKIGIIKEDTGASIRQLARVLGID